MIRTNPDHRVNVPIQRATAVPAVGIVGRLVIQIAFQFMKYAIKEEGKCAFRCQRKHDLHVECISRCAEKKAALKAMQQFAQKASKEKK
jgi:hypothetical protein